MILEPVVGNSGFIVPSKEFLQGLREITKAEGALLCFDEVMTGFRIAKGCAQEYFGITPDLTTMGKVRPRRSRRSRMADRNCRSQTPDSYGRPRT